MIFKSYELSKIKDKKFSLFLFYGKNNYQKTSEFNKLIDDERSNKIWRKRFNW